MSIADIKVNSTDKSTKHSDYSEYLNFKAVNFPRLIGLEFCHI